MSIQFSETVRNAILDAIETAIGASAVLKIISGTKPANCAASDSGTVLAVISLPADWMAAAASGAKAKSGTWSVSSATANGTAGHYRIYASGGAVHSQGTITVTGGGGDLTLDNTAIAAGQIVTVTAFTWTAPNA